LRRELRKRPILAREFRLAQLLAESEELDCAENLLANRFFFPREEGAVNVPADLCGSETQESASGRPAFCIASSDDLRIFRHPYWELGLPAGAESCAEEEPLVVASNLIPPRKSTALPAGLKSRLGKNFKAGANFIGASHFGC